MFYHFFPLSAKAVLNPLWRRRLVQAPRPPLRRSNCLCLVSSRRCLGNVVCVTSSCFYRLSLFYPFRVFWPELSSAPSSRPPFGRFVWSFTAVLKLSRRKRRRITRQWRNMKMVSSSVGKSLCAVNGAFINYVAVVSVSVWVGVEKGYDAAVGWSRTYGDQLRRNLILLIRVGKAKIFLVTF